MKQKSFAYWTCFVIIACFYAFPNKSFAAAETEIEVNGTKLYLNGVSLHSELRQEWFLNGLYLSKKSRHIIDIKDNSLVKRMHWKTLASDLGARRLKRFWIERIRNNNDPKIVAKYSQDIREFTNLLGQKLEKSDTIDIDYFPNQATIISVNGSKIGSLKPQMFNLVLNTWIGSRPPSLEYQEQILGSRVASNYDKLLIQLSSKKE